MDRNHLVIGVRGQAAIVKVCPILVAGSAHRRSVSVHFAQALESDLLIAYTLSLGKAVRRHRHQQLNMAA